MEKTNARQEMDSIRAINKEIYKEVKNPYLKIFLILAIERENYKELF
jgi:hypothetical protein